MSDSRRAARRRVAVLAVPATRGCAAPRGRAAGGLPAQLVLQNTFGRYRVRARVCIAQEEPVVVFGTMPVNMLHKEGERLAGAFRRWLDI